MHKRRLGSLVALLPGPLAAGLLCVPTAVVAPAPAVAAGTPSCAVPEVPARWCAAVSTPVRDSYYPGPSRKAVDALHYRLALRWQPAHHRLVGRERLALRVVHTRARLSLALAARMHVDSASIDGEPVAVRRHRNSVQLRHRVTRGSVHRVRLEYHGTVRKALPLRKQRDALGMYRTPSGDIFTNDEPTGAHQWYAVNDQPSDKAYYDFRLSVPAPRVGVANGRLTSRTRVGRHVVTRFHLAAPMASYLATVEFGNYRMSRAGKVNHTPVRLWTPAGNSRAAKRALHRARYFPRALAYVEKKLGPYPFDTLSLIVVPGYDGGMENQTLVTVGDTGYDTARETLVHEVAHQWYGDQVTPADWSDVWMNEGMATLVQYAWLARKFDVDFGDLVASTSAEARSSWRRAGAPGAYHHDKFAQDNVYYPPMIMWDQLRRRVGDPLFWAMVRAWPAEHPAGNATRAGYTSWVGARLGLDLTGFFDRWLTGSRMPKVDHGQTQRVPARVPIRQGHRE